jgi:hypothetical protein
MAQEVKYPTILFLTVFCTAITLLHDRLVLLLLQLNGMKVLHIRTVTDSSCIYIWSMHTIKTEGIEGICNAIVHQEILFCAAITKVFIIP